MAFSLSQLYLKGGLPLHLQKPYLQSSISALEESLSFSSLFNSILLDLPFRAQPQRHPSALTIEMVS